MKVLKQNKIGKSLLVSGLALEVIYFLRPYQLVSTFGSYNYYLLPALLFLSLGALFLKALTFFAISGKNTVSPLQTLADYIVYHSTFSNTSETSTIPLLRRHPTPIKPSVTKTVICSLTDYAIVLIMAGVGIFLLTQEKMTATSIVLLCIVSGLLIVLLRNYVYTLWINLNADSSDPSWWKRLKNQLQKSVVTRFASAACLFGLTIFLQLIILKLTFIGFSFSLPWNELFGVYAISRLLGEFSPLPDGIGITEITGAALLTQLYPVEIQIAAAGMIIFRLTIVLLPLMLFYLSHLVFWPRAVSLSYD
jgi:hypothetical protein